MRNAFIQTVKTIAQSMIDKAGFDKTRTGQVVGVNSITNTYSVKVDEHTYNNVRTVNDATYNIHDIVKLVIPCNQATQMYIESSVLSDDSLGNKVGHAIALGEENQREITEAMSKIDALGNLWQLYIVTSHINNNIVCNGVLLKNGIDVTYDTELVDGVEVPLYTNDMEWTAKGTTRSYFLGRGAVLTLSQNTLYYGKVIQLKWALRTYMSLMANGSVNGTIVDGNLMGRNRNDSTQEQLVGRTEFDGSVDPNEDEEE